MKYNVIIWAAGANAKEIIKSLNDDVRILAVVDNNPQRWGEDFEGSVIIDPVSVFNYEFDFIIISSPAFQEIKMQITEMGVDERAILSPFNLENENRSLMRLIFSMSELVYFLISFELKNLYRISRNAGYEISAGIGKGVFSRPKIASCEDTLEMLRRGYSMSRFGDGELDMIQGRFYSTFQKPDKRLIHRLKEVLVSNVERHIVCLPDVYGDFSDKNEEHTDWFRRHLDNGGRERDYENLDLKKQYYNTFVTRPYKDYIDKDKYSFIFEAFKELWHNREILIIEGEKTRFGVGNDLLDGVSSCSRILCPAVDAFNRYDEILEIAKEYSKGKIVLIALGQTATVLSYDLAKLGRQAWDIGHLDIEYEWYLRKTDKKIPIKGKYVNEVPQGRIVTECIGDQKYESEILVNVCKK